jgi:hypothetical protein
VSKEKKGKNRDLRQKGESRRLREHVPFCAGVVAPAASVAICGWLEFGPSGEAIQDGRLPSSLLI